MKRKEVESLLLLLVLSMLSSCCIKEMMEEEQPVSFVSSNVYKDLDMDVFKGFVDKMTVGELIKEHGEPDTILDANEVAMVEGYDIYQYEFSDGTIDCYIPKVVDKKLTGGILEDTLINDELVDYIYYEPNKNVPLKSFIKNDTILKQIPQGKSVVYYVGDPFRNFIRFRLAKENKGEILNIALNDVSMFQEQNALASIVNEWNEKLPISLGDFGYIDEMKFEKKFVTFTLCTNDSLIDIDEMTKENPSWDYTIAVRLFDKRGGVFHWLSDVVIREGAGVTLCLKNENNDVKTVSKSIDFSAFKNTFEKGISNIERLQAFTEYENLTLPYSIDDEFTHEKLKIEDNLLVIPLEYEEEAPEVPQLDFNQIKLHEQQLLLNPDNPERNYYFLCFNCNYGVKKIYTFAGSGKSIEIVFSPEEVKKVIKEM